MRSSSAIRLCPICCSSDVAGWGASNGYRLYRCESCTHRFADVGNHGVLHDDADVFRARFTHDLMKSDADYYRHLCSGEQEGGPTRETARRIFHALQHLRLPPNRNWLDIGCGSGYLLVEASRRGWKSVGIEPGGWGQIAAREKGIEIRQAFLDSYTFSGKFGCISATDVLEHQPNPHALLDLVDFYLAAGGLAFVSLPYADSFQGRVMRDRWSMVKPPTHCQFFTRRSVDRLVDRSDLRVFNVVQFNASYPPLIGRTRLGRAACDWLLRSTLGGDQVLIVLRKRADAEGTTIDVSDVRDHGHATRSERT